MLSFCIHAHFSKTHYAYFQVIAFLKNCILTAQSLYLTMIGHHTFSLQLKVNFH